MSILITAQVFLEDTADRASLASHLPALERQISGLTLLHAGENCPGSWGAGAFTLDGVAHSTADAAHLASALGALPGVTHADAVAYTAVGSGLRAPGLRGGIWRTLMLRVRPEASTAQVAGLEQDLLTMPRYMAGIRNWRLSRVVSPSRWTHVWQQEYQSIDDLQGEYLLHPFHWGWVDHWFDPEFPDWTVDTQLSHAFCALPESIIHRQENP